jgi:cell division protein FtsI (penicillin-binding protein 3)
VIRSIAAIVSGVLRPVTLLKTMEPPKGKQVLSPQVSEQIRFLLTQAAMNGQAKKATVNGYLVGAKTGTANLQNAKGAYVEKQNMTSCVAILPADDPEYILLVTVERPKPNAQTYGYATAGWIAAPLVSDIFTAVGPVLGLSPLPKEQAFELIPAATDLTRAPDRSPRPPLLLTTDALLNDL